MLLCVGEKPINVLDNDAFQVLDVYKALQDALPGPSRGAQQDGSQCRPIAGLYLDDSDSKGLALLVRISISDVGYLHELRNTVLAGHTARLLKEKLCRLEDIKSPRVSRVEVDLTHFAEKYEESVLSLEKLTPHQQDALMQCRGTGSWHLKAPAGAGKT